MAAVQSSNGAGARVHPSAAAAPPTTGALTHFQVKTPDGISAAGARQISYAATRLTAVGLAAGNPDVLAKLRSSVFRPAI